MKSLLTILLSGAAWIASLALAAGDAAPARIKAYYTRLPFEDHGFTGKYADIVVELPQRGQFIFSREFGHQPRWLPVGGRGHSVARPIPRKGDGPDERPDGHNIACNAAVVARADESVTVHWRYAPDSTKPAFADFRSAYNEAGNPAPFYADYADEYFTIQADGTSSDGLSNCGRSRPNRMKESPRASHKASLDGTTRPQPVHLRGFSGRCGPVEEGCVLESDGVECERA